MAQAGNTDYDEIQAVLVNFVLRNLNEKSLLAFCSLRAIQWREMVQANPDMNGPMDAWNRVIDTAKRNEVEDLVVASVLNELSQEERELCFLLARYPKQRKHRKDAPTDTDQFDFHRAALAWKTGKDGVRPDRGKAGSVARKAYVAWAVSATTRAATFERRWEGLRSTVSRKFHFKKKLLQQAQQKREVAA